MGWHCRMVLMWMVVVAGGPVAASDHGVADRHPVYVGVRVCVQCHSGPSEGHLFSRWRTAPHARAYAVLWSPTSKKIARLSGITEEPQAAAACLGCHTAGYDTEEWEREDGFFFEDGVQCESCHGPGSEYIRVMTEDMDREEAMRLGLKMPTKRVCIMCHNVKGSHVAYLENALVDIDKAMPKACGRPDRKPVNPASKTTQADEDPPSDGRSHRYVGVMNCAGCHRGPMMGYQFSKWREGKHARAYAVLGTKAGYEMAVKAGVSGNPQESPQCLKCHVTGAGQAKSRFVAGFDRGDGVQCESCHGPGSEYWPEAVMRDPKAAEAAGLLPVSEDTCRGCHEGAHDRPFDYAAAMRKIAHPTRESEADASALGVRYKTPLNLAISPDGRELYVACEASDTVIVVDTRSREAVAELTTGGQPNDVTFSPEGKLAYVTNRLDDSLTVIDVQSRSVLRTVPVGDEPHGVLADRSGERIYVLDTSEDQISVLDAETLQETSRLTASRAPWSLAMSPDGRTIAVTNTLSRFVEFRTPSRSEITFIDTASATVVNRAVARGANLMQGVA